MAKNIVIFSDGTGQRGGMLFDERRSNIYKLYRAMRCSPDSTVDPNLQFAFYDAGIGTLPSGIGFLGAIGQKLYNVVCQATGLGLTGNIVDCYAQIIRNYEPGDRIWLFGFSRGAYTVRCLAAVISMCGVPTRMKDGSPLRRDEATCKAIAREAVTQVYQHVSSPKDTKHLGERKALAARFRERHRSAGADETEANVYPHFIGVFDTVAALGNLGSMLVVAVIAAVLLGIVGLAGWALIGGFWVWVFGAAAIASVVGFAAYLKTHVKVAFGLPGIPWWKTLHMTAFRMRFYDQQLNPKVGWARHALAIDERRKDFDRVPWGDVQDWRRTAKDEPPWFEQVWFAGNHSDVGGSYPETESRLSDIALEWMLSEASKVPGGLQVDRSVLRTYPSATGMQHDETRGWAFRFGKKIDRKINPQAPLHPTVIARFEADAVLHYDETRPYRPEGLRAHEKAAPFYRLPSATGLNGDTHEQAASPVAASHQ